MDLDEQMVFFFCMLRSNSVYDQILIQLFQGCNHIAAKVTFFNKKEKFS